jgi:hypothetical protein
MWWFHFRYRRVRDRVIIYDAEVIGFSSEIVYPNGNLTVFSKRRCDITLFIPATGETLEISSVAPAAKRLKRKKHTKIYYFPDEIYDPTVFARQKLLAFEILVRSTFSAVMFTLFGLLAVFAGAYGLLR